MNTSSYLDRLLAIIGSVFDAYSAVLIMRFRPEDSFRIGAFFSLGNKIDAEATIMPGKGLVGWVVANERPLLVNNVDQHKNHLGYYIDNEDAFIKAFMACPLGNGRGALCVDSKRQYSFAEKDQKILHLFANLILDIQTLACTGSVSKSYEMYYKAIQLITSLRKRFSQWHVFLHHFLQILSETSGFSYCFFASRDESGEKYFLEGENEEKMGLPKDKAPSFPMGAGLVGWMFKHASPIFESNAERVEHLFGVSIPTPAFQSVVCLPLVINRITRGVLCLTNEQEVSMTEDLKNFLQISAQYLALFLENLYLKSKLKFATDSLEKFARSSRTPTEPFITPEK